MQPLSIDCRYLIRHTLNDAQGTRAKGDGKATYTVGTVPMQVYIRPMKTRTENTSMGLVKTTFYPAVCYSDIKVGDCLGSTTARQFKVTAVMEVPMSDGQRQLELKKI